MHKAHEQPKLEPNCRSDSHKLEEINKVIRRIEFLLKNKLIEAQETPKEEIIGRFFKIKKIDKYFRLFRTINLAFRRYRYNYESRFYIIDTYDSNRYYCHQDDYKQWKLRENILSLIEKDLDDLEKTITDDR